MDIQLFATDDELREFPEHKTVPESKTDPDKIPSANSINLSTSDLPKSPTDLPKIQSSLPVRKPRYRRRTKRSHRHTSKFNSGIPTASHLVIQLKDCLPIQERTCRSFSPTATVINPIVNRSVIQVNDCLAPVQKKQSIIQMIDAWLTLVSHSVSQSVSPQ